MLLRCRAAAFCAALAGLVLLCAAGGATAKDGDGGKPPEAVLYAEWESLLKYRDFSSFSKRMAVIRSLGRLRTQEAALRLIHIVRNAKTVDDKVVALMAIGPKLDLPTAKEAGALVARRESEVLVEALGSAYEQAEDPATLAWLADGALRSSDLAIVRAALEAQWAHGDPAARERIHELYLEHSPKRKGIDIAYQCVRALGSINGPKARRFLLRATGHDDGRIRLAAADVMARQKPVDLNVRGALRKLLVDPLRVVRQRAAESLGEAKLDELVPELAAHLNRRRIRTRAIAHKALRRITGKDLGWDPAEWIEWWNHRSADDGGSRPKPSTSVATYYGLKVYSDRVLFIVDLSGSMAFPWGKDDTRIGVARAELSRVLSRLSKDTLFNVIVFSDKVKAWRQGEALATEEAVAKALEWVGKTFTEPRGGTFMHAALEQAFAENPKIDTIFLLTDGLATDGEPIVPEAILASLRVWNRYRRVVIHTIALTLEELDPTGVPKRDLDQIKRFMKQIASSTGGQSKVITKPP